MKIKPEIESTLPNKVVTMENSYIGALVMRGPDWDWGNQDGGIGSIGVITQDHPIKGAIIVKWSHKTSEHGYRIGLTNKYDLIFAK